MLKKVSKDTHTIQRYRHRVQTLFRLSHPFMFFWFHFFCHCTGLFKMIVRVLTTCHTQYTCDSSICIFYLIEQHSKFLLNTLQVLYMCTICDSTGLFKMIVRVLTTCHTQYTCESSICIFYLIEQHSKFLLNTLQVLYMCTICDSTGLFKMIVVVLTTCHTQYTFSSICIFLFNRTTLQVFVTYLTVALYVHHL